MIVVAVIVIILTLAIPTYSNYSIRAKISEALSFAETVEITIGSACQEDRTIASLTNQLAGYKFQASKYVQKIVISGTCSMPTITVTTRATGTRPNPVLTITGDFAEDTDQITWTCVSSGLNIHVPESCRS
jgi:type IV pilus assembly protein PilA